MNKTSSDFYMYKINNLDLLIERKKEFMVKVVHIIATSSYLAETMKGTKMPEEVKKMLGKLNHQLKS